MYGHWSHLAYTYCAEAQIFMGYYALPLMQINICNPGACLGRGGGGGGSDAKIGQSNLGIKCKFSPFSSPLPGGMFFHL